MSGAKKPWRQEMPDFLQFLENSLGPSGPAARRGARV